MEISHHRCLCFEVYSFPISLSAPKIRVLTGLTWDKFDICELHDVLLKHG
jgi:hypothetical protein